MTSPDLVRIVHRERHGQLVADAAARRLRRQLAAERDADRPQGRRRPIGTRLARRRSRRDGKIERLRGSWLQPGRRAARRLAQLADLVDVEAGTVLAPGRFAYIGFDEQHAGLVVAKGTPTVALTSRAEVLVLGDGAFDEMRRSIPAIGAAWARATRVPVERAASHEAKVADGRPLRLTLAGTPRRDVATCAGRDR